MFNLQFSLVLLCYTNRDWYYITQCIVFLCVSLFYQLFSPSFANSPLNENSIARWITDMSQGWCFLMRLPCFWLTTLICIWNSCGPRMDPCGTPVYLKVFAIWIVYTNELLSVAKIWFEYFKSRINYTNND